MTPRILPPGHFVGDGHNHGAETEDHVHNHGHDHAHESPEQHLHHMQERQQARGRATLEEFHQAARETAQLTSGQKPESASSQRASRGEPRAQTREQAGDRSNPSENRLPAAASQNRGPNGEAARSSPRDFSGLARIFSAAFAASPNGASPWAEASRQGIRQPRPQPDQGASRQPAGSESAARNTATPETTGRNFNASNPEAASEHQPILQALAKLQVALQEAGPRGLAAQKILPEAAEALAVLLQEVAISPEFLASLPPTLKTLVQQLMSPYGALLSQLLPKLTVAGFAQALQVLLGQGISTNLAAVRSGAEASLHGLGLLVGAPLFAPATIARPLSSSLLQRFEKALIQFLQLFSAKPAKEAPSLDKALLEQLAALVAAEEKRRKEKERTRKKEEVPTALRAKRDSNFNDPSQDEHEGSAEPMMRAYG